MVAACVATRSATVTTTVATYFNHHNQLGFADGFGGGGCKKDMETNSNPPTASKGVTMATAEVGHLRQQLQSVVENGDLTASNACFEQLEKAVLSKDTLEATRIGRFVNDIRKQTAQQWPDFSKRCRALIKQWQKLAEYRPSSSCEGSSNGGTPQLVSPVLKRGLTPRTGAVATPGKRATPQQQQQQRVTSTGLCPPDSRQLTGRSSSTLSSSVSPVENGVPTASSGSYAPLPSTGAKDLPRQSAANLQQHNMHKSASVGAALSSLGRSSAAKRTVPMLNGIAEDGGAVGGGAQLAFGSSYADMTKEFGAVQPPPVSSTAPAGPSSTNPPLTLKLKRSASGVQRLTSSLSPTPNNGIGAASTSAPVVGQQPQQQSVLAARQNVQSTAQLVAQLSMALPQNIGIDLSNKMQQQQTIGPTAAGQKIITKISSEPIPTSADGIKRRHQKRKGGRASEERTDATLVKQMKGTDTGETFTGVKREEEQKEEKKEGKGGEERDKRKATTESESQETGKEGKRGRKKKKDKQQQREEIVGTKFNWFAEFPFDGNDPAASVSAEGEGQSAATGGIPAQVYTSPTRSFVLPAHERHLLLLPYMDIGLPDWRVHNFPEPDRFLFPEPSEWHKKPS